MLSYRKKAENILHQPRGLAFTVPYHPGKYHATMEGCFSLLRPHQRAEAGCDDHTAGLVQRVSALLLLKKLLLNNNY